MEKSNSQQHQKLNNNLSAAAPLAHNSKLRNQEETSLNTQVDDTQKSQFIRQSTDMHSSPIQGTLGESNIDNSLFDNKIYNQSIIEESSHERTPIRFAGTQNASKEDTGLQNQAVKHPVNLESSSMQHQDHSLINQDGQKRLLNQESWERDHASRSFFSSERTSIKNLDEQQFQQKLEEITEKDTDCENVYYNGMKGSTGHHQKLLKKGQRVPFPVKTHTIDRIVFPVQTKRGIKYGKKRASSQEKNFINISSEPRKMVKLLDGFLVLYSCRVKLPHEAIKSKLASQELVEVIEEDLCYFQNLNSIDLSDNQIKFEQLKNLRALAEVNLQYNQIKMIPPIQPDDFQRVETLNLSYNQLTPASIRSLYSLQRLKNIDLQGNNLVTLPEDMGQLSALQDLNLSSNLFSSGSTLVNPSLLFKILGSIPKLKRLNLSRNNFSGLHSEFLQRGEDFQLLQELDFGFNAVMQEEDLWYTVQLNSLQILVITGNLFATEGKDRYSQLEETLQKNMSAVVINDAQASTKDYLRKQKPQRQLATFPYPNPIKLFSREVQKEIKGGYLNAEMMNQGVALQISELRPNTNIEKEIFPRELTQDAQHKDIFTPPNHKQMRFEAGQQSKPTTSEEDKQFFITENIEQFSGIKEEMTQDSDLDGLYNQGLEEENEEEEEEYEKSQKGEDFDFGKAKMEYFKQRAREILISEDEPHKNSSTLGLPSAYKNLKAALRNPVVVHSSAHEQPHYMKTTFSMCRNAVNGEKFLEISKLKESTSKHKPPSSEMSSFLGSQKGNSQSIAQSRLPPLMRAGKELAGDSDLAKALLGPQKMKSRKEQQIDKKIEYLLETYKRQDEELLKKTQDKEKSKSKNNKVLRDKFGFSDDEEEGEEGQSQERLNQADQASYSPQALQFINTGSKYCPEEFKVVDEGPALVAVVPLVPYQYSNYWGVGSVFFRKLTVCYLCNYFLRGSLLASCEGEEARLTVQKGLYSNFFQVVQQLYFFDHVDLHQVGCAQVPHLDCQQGRPKQG